MQKLFRFSTFKSLYGQAGSVKFNLINGFHQVNLSTHWEDNCEYICDPELNFLFEDDNDKSQLINTHSGSYTVNINIPEYYGYNGSINGNIKHKSTNIDAKLYGNIDIVVTGSFEAEKIKSEICNISAKTLNINSSLETQLGELNIDNNIKIKKLLTSKQVTIKQKSGYLDIMTAYVQKKQQYQFPILIKQQYLDFINQNNHVSLITDAKDIKIGTFSGLIDGKLNGKSLFIKSLSGMFNISQTESVELGITNQQCQGYIKGSKITLNMFDQLKFNIFKNGISLSDFNDSLYSIYTECDELIVRNINNPFGMI